ncbi:hypothetical protein Cgig2_004864 [Carnegiea gigantea]|uniref:Uncharacterized protein n=1 Tax=Carnegiea gigantea TaxID=171969 RepID=A0A9Q1Q9G0_9CARY|nr:hypothetical protein Cgig2_004864 [Carnegiea gigantea]
MDIKICRHVAGNGVYFNPEYMYRENQQGNDAEVRVGVQRVIIRNTNNNNESDNNFDNNDPINPGLPEKEQLVFEGDDLHWLNEDGQDEDNSMNIEDDEDQQLGVSPPFHYNVDQQSEGTYNNESGGDLSHPSSRDGSGDGGNGGNRGGNDIGIS